MSSGTSSVRLTVARVLAVLAGVASLVVVVPMSAGAATVTGLQQSWGTNGRVNAVLADPASGRVYVAGNFSAVTDAAGTTSLPIANVAAFLPASGTFDPTWHPNPDGVVTSLGLSGGKLYLGGDFTQVQGTTRTRLAAVDAVSGALTPWSPAATGGMVDALAVSGGAVYVGGSFTTLAGVTRSYLGRVSVSTGNSDTNWTPRPNARVRSLVVPGDGSVVYVGGSFTTINGSSSARSIASLSTTTPATLTKGFNAGATNAGSEPPAMGLYVEGSDLLAAVAGAGGGCASLDAKNGRTQWSKHANGNVQTVTAMNGTAYCGGHFTGTASFDGQNRNKLAAVDQASGQTLGLSLRINSALGVWALSHDATRLFLGGDFTKINGKPQPHFAVLT